MRRLVIAASLLSLVLASSLVAEERAPSPRERISKIVRIIKKLLLPTPQDDLSWPHP